MKHIVTLSLVFFSLTHLAQTQRVEGLRLLSERYSNEHRIHRDTAPSIGTQLNEDRNPFFLSHNELTLIGTLPEVSTSAYQNHNQVIADLTIRKKPKNNSP